LQGEAVAAAEDSEVVEEVEVEGEVLEEVGEAGMAAAAEVEVLGVGVAEMVAVEAVVGEAEGEAEEVEEVE
jgi:hypothetical protein